MAKTRENNYAVVVSSPTVSGLGFCYDFRIPAQRVLSFLGKVSFARGTCWEWTAAKNEHGYGAFWSGDRNIPAHRFAWLIFRGTISRGNHIHHVCKNPTCVNPDHLLSVTPAAHLLLYTPENHVYAAARAAYCKRGHPLFGPNMREAIDSNGVLHRRCRTCLREWAAAKSAANRKPKQERTHCAAGHELTPENTYEWCGEKSCKTCHNAYSAKSYAKRHPPKAPKPPKTHCVNGHPWIEENLYRTGKEGKKVVVCYVCHKEGQRKSYEKRKARFGKFWNKPVVV